MQIDKSFHVGSQRGIGMCPMMRRVSMVPQVLMMSTFPRSFTAGLLPAVPMCRRVASGPAPGPWLIARRQQHRYYEVIRIYKKELLPPTVIYQLAHVLTYRSIRLFRAKQTVQYQYRVGFYLWPMGFGSSFGLLLKLETWRRLRRC